MTAAVLSRPKRPYKPVRDVRNLALVAELRARVAELEQHLAGVPAAAKPKRAAAKSKARAGSLEAHGIQGFTECASRRPPAGSAARLLETTLATAGPEAAKRQSEWRPSETGGLKVTTVSELEAHEREMDAAGKITSGMRRDFTARSLSRR